MTLAASGNQGDALETVRAAGVMFPTRDGSSRDGLPGVLPTPSRCSNRAAKWLG
jgi:hypothetical protein